MRVINTVPLQHPADFFQRPEEAIMHGLSTARAHRVRDEFPSVRGARVVDGRCDLTSVTFITSNDMDLRYFVHDGIADWHIERSSSNLRQPQMPVEPVLLRSQFGECTFDPVKLLATCVGRAIVSMSADLSHAQLLLRNLPLAFFANSVKETGELLLVWCDTREPDE